ncbi:MAG: helicase-related protein [Thermodesulfobacteriaceae bacterium]|jgi:superfamily II DNA or RNA helicase
MLKEGSIIEGDFWPEPVEVKRVEKVEDGYRIVGSTINSHQHIDDFIAFSDLPKIKTKEFLLSFTQPGSEAFLALEALRFRYASLFDPLLAVNVSKVEPLPFQIEAVYGYILKLPHIRFLLADDPGAGKTIMAGLVIKELKLRGLARRILIVVPGHLKDQWRREMEERFKETFAVFDRDTLNAFYGDNFLLRNNQVITSMDFAKQEEILPLFASSHWDLTIVDEAHKMAAYRYGEKVEKTQRYKLGETLSKTSTHLLFLTATPHKGDPENFRLLLDLLKPGFFATSEMVEASLRDKDNPLFIRRLKEDLRDFEGKPLFTNRYPKTIKFRLSDEERELYQELSQYVVEQYNRALTLDKKRNIGFALLILQRRMASSTYALLKSLERRKNRLEDLLKSTELNKKLPNLEDFDEVEDYEEKERWEIEEKWETISLARNKEELKKEIWTIERLIERAKEILAEEKEVKLSELKKAIEEGFRKLKEVGGNEKILVFTESKDTLEYLVNKIKSWGYSVNYIHGGMDLNERVKAEKVFRDETQIMIATEAAGEGINLQFCNLMINYDIPWNPNRLEQRIGRIHRYGQQKDVFIFNLVAIDTIEGRILSKLFDKLEEIKEKLGSDRVFDIIGEVFLGKNLYQLIVEAIVQAKTLDEIIKEIDIEVDEEYIRKVKSALGESLATKFIDYTRIKELFEKAKENRLIPEYVEEFFKKAFTKAGGKYHIRKDGFISIESLPSELKNLAQKQNITLDKYPKVTFDKEKAFKNPDAEFISFGHPLLETLIDWVHQRFLNNLQKGAMFEDPDGKYNGIIWFFEGEVKDGKGETAGKRIFAIYDDMKNNFTEINPAVIWDFIPIDNPNEVPNIENLRQRKEDAEKFARSLIIKYKKEIEEERARQAEIKEKYGIKSLEYLINKLDEELVLLIEREDKGEEVRLAIQNKEERKKYYQRALDELKEEIKREKTLTITWPRFKGAILVKPKKTDQMVSDEEIERIGMEIAMEYERSQGREPEDVSKENLGFDIRSRGKDEIRYIEVKARKDEGDVALTVNEWLKAKRFKESYWLYIVCNAITSPTLYIINNPADNLKVQDKVEVVRFIVPLEEWKKKGERV